VWRFCFAFLICEQEESFLLVKAQQRTDCTIAFTLSWGVHWIPRWVDKIMSASFNWWVRLGLDGAADGYLACLCTLFYLGLCTAVPDIAFYRYTGVEKMQIVY
jgi:hypothetical protein